MPRLPCSLSLGLKFTPTFSTLALLFSLLSGSAHASDWVYETGDLRGVWGTASSNVYAVGNRGLVLRYNGSGWKPVRTGLGEYACKYKLKDVWGSSATDIFAVGCFDPGCDERFEECIIDRGVILYYDGVSWQAMNVGETENLRAVWGSSASDVFAVGTQGAILHYDGNAWSAMESGVTESLSAVWGTAGSDVYAVGEGGRILRYNGVDWKPEPSGTAADLKGVWGASATDVFVVGDSGTLLRNRGSGWAPSTSGTTQALTDIWGSSATNVFAVGDGGTTLRFNGTAWSAMSSGTTSGLKAVWGSAGSNIFAVGDGTVVAWCNGSTWSIQSEVGTGNLSNPWGTSENNVFVLGGPNGTILRYTGIGWKGMDSGTTETLTSLWGTSSSNVYASGYNGTVHHYDGSAWTTIHSASDTILYDIWGSSDTDVYAVGRISSELTGLMLHYDGTSWTEHILYGGLDLWQYASVWGTGPGDVFIAAEYSDDSAPGLGDGIPVGVILHFDGSAWSATELDDYHVMIDLWGSGADDVHAVGDRIVDLSYHYPRAFHFDGSGWRSAPWDVPYVGSFWLHSVWGRSAVDTFAVGWATSDRGHIILRNTGGAWWLDRLGNLEPALFDVWASTSGHVFAVGSGGTIMRLLPESETAVPPGPTWARTYGGVSREEARTVEPTDGGGLILAGQATSFGAGGSDVWVMKLDAEGDIIWEKTLGGVNDEDASSIKETLDGGFIVAGSTAWFDASGSDAWIVKLDGAGKVDWEKAYGGAGDDMALEILTLGNTFSGGGYAVMGKTHTGPEEWDAWVMKLGSQGEVSWRKTYPIAGSESLVSFAQGKGYGYFLSGKTQHAAPGYSDFLVIRLDDEGEVVWAKTFNLELWSTGIEQEAKLFVTRDGGVVLAGQSGQVGIPTFAWVVKLNALGDVEWQRRYEPTGNADVFSIRQTRDLGYIIGGRVSVRFSRYDGWLMKLDHDGEIEWQKVYGSLDPLDRDHIFSVRQTPDGGYVTAGWTESLDGIDSDFWVLRLDETGLIADCAGVSTWYGGSIETTQPGADVSIAAETLETAEAATHASVLQTGVTGQDACLSAVVDLIDLPQTGEIESDHPGGDGRIRAGTPWPFPRFADNGDGTVTDYLTGLIWLKDADCLGAAYWETGLDLVADFNSNPAAYSCTDYDTANPFRDWRAPNVNELESLANAAEPDVAAWLNEQGFVDVKPEPYYSSTASSDSSSVKWIVVMNSGIPYNSYSPRPFWIWPVRAGQQFHPDPAYPANVWKTGQIASHYPGDDGDIQAGVAWPVPRFTDNGDGTVTDNLTGLIWLKDSTCFKDTGAFTIDSWEQGLDAIAIFNADPGAFNCAEYDPAKHRTGWRVPNKKELLSLIDRSRVAPALPTGHPFVHEPGFYYWSSTTYAADPNPMAWVTDFYTGRPNYFLKSSTYPIVWPVRGYYLRADVNGNGLIELTDAILALQVLSRMQPSMTIRSGVDVDSDSRIGIEEAIYVLQWLSGLR